MEGGGGGGRGGGLHFLPLGLLSVWSFGFSFQCTSPLRRGIHAEKKEGMITAAREEIAPPRWNQIQVMRRGLATCHIIAFVAGGEDCSAPPRPPVSALNSFRPFPVNVCLILPLPLSSYLRPYYVCPECK